MRALSARLDLPPGIRIGGAVVVGLVVGLAPRWDSMPAAALGGWAAAGLVHVVWVWLVIAPRDAPATAAPAAREEPARLTERVVVLLAAIASLAALVVVLVGGGVRRDVVTLSTVLAAVVASWASVHTLFALRYARLYFSDPRPGIDFHQDGPPCYTDFTYLAFTVGMSFAVSDTDLRSSTMRRAAQTQALLAYLYGTVIVALLVNLVAGLAG
jgi:uncharacterized membrane protein